jgi:hypothetical protein
MYLHALRRTCVLRYTRVYRRASRISDCIALAVAGLVIAIPFPAQAVPDFEREKLIAIYNSTNGANWTIRANWRNFDDTDFAAAGSECNWHGVFCTPPDAMGNRFVRLLALGNNNLAGTLPTSISALQKLESANFSNIGLSGGLPELNGMTNLKTFAAKNGQFSGQIPNLTSLAALQVFDVSNNKLTGPLPSLAGLSALQHFRVTSNQLSGVLPALSSTTALVEFDVSINRFTGAIPSLTGLTQLERFVVTGNQLTGSMPSLNDLASLKALLIYGNQLTGTITAPPQPSSLVAGESGLCPNQLSASNDAAVNAAWNVASFQGNWSTGCVAPKLSQSLSFLTPPTNTYAVTTFSKAAVVAPSPGSSAATVYKSITPFMCAIDAATGVVAMPLFPQGNDSFCRITADKAGDATYNSAPQILQALPVISTCRLDVDADGERTAATDGALVARYLLGFRGSALLSGVPLGPSAARTIPNDVQNFIASHLYDVKNDAPPATRRLRDALIITRFLLGINGDDLVANTDIPLAEAATIANNIQSWCPLP